MEFVQNYLELEKLRFGNKFIYKFQISEEVNEEFMFPRMGIQTFVENSIKHGLMHKEKDGLLVVKVSNPEKHLHIEIIDNGVGRETAEKLSYGSTHKGLEIIKQFYDLYNEIHQEKINFKIIDLYDENYKPDGTRVIINVP